jgi:hypothetical protein
MIYSLLKTGTRTYYLDISRPFLSVYCTYIYLGDMYNINIKRTSHYIKRY